MRPPCNILIADDDEPTRRLLEVILNGQDYVLSFAQNGEEALAKAESTPPDLILVDADMPKVDGFELCRRTRAHSRLAQVPVILLVSSNAPNSRLTGLKAGADDCLTKPIDKTELRARVKSLARLRRIPPKHGPDLPLWHELSEHSEDGLLHINPDGALTFANPQACRYLGLSPDIPIAGQDFLTLVGGRFSLQPLKAWEHWPTTNKGTTQTVRYLLRPETSAQSALWLRVSTFGSPRSETGQIVQLRNATEEIQAERALWQFHSQVANKLHSPLLSIVQSLEDLQDAASVLPREELQDLAHAARQFGTQLQKDVEELLMDRPQSSSDSPHDQSFALTHLAELVDQVAARIGVEEVTTVLEPSLHSASLPLSNRMVETLLGELFDQSKHSHPHQDPTVCVSAYNSTEGKVTLRITDDRPSVSDQDQGAARNGRRKDHGRNQTAPHLPGLDLTMINSMLMEKGGGCHLLNRDPGPGVVVELHLPQAA